MKPVGQWYVRKERRGLVCLVNENRHAVETLKHLEDQTPQTDPDSIENEQPLAFADIFPLSATSHKRGQSPERKFVVSFRPQSNGDHPRSQETDVYNGQAGPRNANGDRILPLSSPLENQTHLDLHSDTEIIGLSNSSHSTRKSRVRARKPKEQETSRLILDVIPHEKADEAFKSAQNMSRSMLLEAKAEETIDTLMRRWTYVDPKYFSEDDRLSISSAERSLPYLHGKTFQRSHEDKDLGPAERFSSPCENSRRRRSDVNLGNIDPTTNGLHDSQSVSFEEDSNLSSSLPTGRPNAKKRPSPLLPTYKGLESGRRGKTGILPRTPEDPEFRSLKEPSTPAPPYLPSHSGQCSSCHAVSPSASTRHENTPEYHTIELRARDAEEGNDDSSSMENAFKILESKILGAMKQPLLQHDTLDAQERQAIEPRESSQQSTIIEPAAEPVILKDCLGRKFLFPIQKCRSWQVSLPNEESYRIKADLVIELQSMESLIRRSFSHVESMNSKIVRGSYDILGPTGEIILPEIWDAVIKPGWVVELRFWDHVEAREGSSEDPNADFIRMAPAVQLSPVASRKSHMADVQLAPRKRRASLMTWLGSRKSIPSVALE